MGLFSKKTKSKSKSSSVSTTPPWHQQMLEDIANKATALGSQPYQPYTGQRVADFTPDQLKSFQMTQNNAGVWQPNMGMADQMTAASGAGFNQGEMNSYLSPYLGGVVDEIGRQGARNLTENLLPGVNDTFTGSGQFGSSRHADFTNNAIRDVNESVMGQQRQALQSGYDSAMQGYFTGRDQKARAGAQMGTLGQMRSQMGYQDAQAMNAVGEQQQARNQALNDVAYQDYMAAQDDPYKKLSWQAQMVSGLPVTQTTNTSSKATQKNSGGVLGDILGGIGMVGGMLTGGGGIGGLLGGGGQAASSMFSAPIATSGMNSGIMAAYGAANPRYYYKKGGLVKRKTKSSPYNDVKVIDLFPMHKSKVRKYEEGGRVKGIPTYGFYQDGLEEDPNDPGLPVNFSLNGEMTGQGAVNQGPDIESLFKVIDQIGGGRKRIPGNQQLDATNILTMGNLPGRSDNIKSAQDAYAKALETFQGSTKPGSDWINMPLFMGGAAMLASDGSLGERLGQAGLAAGNVMQDQRKRDQDLAVGSNQAALEMAADNYKSALKPPSLEEIYTPNGGRQKIYVSPDGSIYQAGGVSYGDTPAGYMRDENGQLVMDPEQIKVQLAIKAAGRESNNINVNSGSVQEKAAEGEFGKVMGTRYGKFVTTGDKAAGQRANLNELTRILSNPNLNSGSLAQTKAEFGRFLVGLGVSEENAAGVVGNISDMESFVRVASQQALAAGQELTGAMSDKDILFLKEQTNNPSLTLEGNKKILNATLRATENAEKIGNLVLDWNARYGIGNRDQQGRTIDMAIDMIRNPARYRKPEERQFFVELNNGDEIDARRITPQWLERNSSYLSEAELKKLAIVAPDNVRKYFTDRVKNPNVQNNTAPSTPKVETWSPDGGLRR